MEAQKHSRPKQGLERILVIICMTMLLVSLVDGGAAEKKRGNQHTSKNRSTIRPIVVELENVCDIQMSLSAYCMCDSLTLQEAETAKCKVFNVTDQNDAIWEAFGTQRNILELQLNVPEDGHLNFIPILALRNIPKVTSLQIRDADIETLLPSSFSDVVQLEILKLNRNKIRQIRPNTFSGLSSVQELELSDNRLQSLEREMFSGLVNCNTLLLNNNNISLVEDQVFMNLIQLQILDLSNNQIGVLTKDTFFALANLRKLLLRGNLLKILGDNTFGYIPKLKTLDLQSNQLQVIRDLALAELSSLTHLNLENNKLTSMVQASFSPIGPNLLNKSMVFSIKGNPLQCSCQLTWLQTLEASSSSDSVRDSVKQLDCSMEGDSKMVISLVQVHSSLDCDSIQDSLRSTSTVPTTTSITKKANKRPSHRNGVTANPTKQSPSVNDSSASLHLSAHNGISIPSEESVSVTTVLSSNQSGGSAPSALSLINLLLPLLIILL